MKKSGKIFSDHEKEAEYIHGEEYEHSIQRKYDLDELLDQERRYREADEAGHYED